MNRGQIQSHLFSWKPNFTNKYSIQLSINWMEICHLEPSSWSPISFSLSLFVCIQFFLLVTRWQTCYAPPPPSNAPLPQLSLMACGGWCFTVMPQENAFHNLLFLLEKRRKRGTGTQTKQTRTEEEIERGGSANEWHQASAAGEVQSPDRAVGRVTGRYRSKKMVCWCGRCI